MNNAAFKNSIRAASAAFLLSAAAFAAPAHAGDTQLLAYAPTQQQSSVFDQFDQQQIPDDEYYEEHELNDAWLGMPVRSSDGKDAGWVSDAILDDNGDVVTVVVDLNGSSHEVDARYADLGDDAVAISLTRSQIASLNGTTPRYEVSEAAGDPFKQFAERIKAAFSPDQQ